MQKLTEAQVYNLAQDSIHRYEYSYGEDDYHYGGLEVLSSKVEGNTGKVLFQDFSATITVEELFDFKDVKINLMGFELDLAWDKSLENWTVTDYVADAKVPGPYVISYNELTNKADFRFSILTSLANSIEEYLYENNLSANELATQIKSDFQGEFREIFC